MKFKANIQELKEAAAIAAAILPKRSTLPVLECLLLELKGSELKITASDQDVTITIKTKVEGAEDGSGLIRGYEFSNFLRNLSSGDIEVAMNPDTLKFTCVSKLGRFTLPGLDAKEYIEIESTNYGDPIEIKGLIDALSEAAQFASRDEYRPAMTGVYLGFSADKLQVVGTDSFRLYKRELDQLGLEADFIIPPKPIAIAAKFDAEPKLKFRKTEFTCKKAAFEFDDTEIEFNLIDENYPPVDSVIPKSFEKKARFLTHELLKRVKLVSGFSSEVSNQIVIEFADGAATVKGFDDDAGKKAEAAVDCNLEGASMRMGFNHRFLAESLALFDADVFFDLNESDKPTVIRESTDESGERIVLIMPVKLPEAS